MATSTRTRRKTTAIQATGEIYPNLQDAFEHFNRKLFYETLPPCLITLQRERATLGYFSPHRFVRYDGQLTHEIAMNPAYFVTRTLRETLSTLAHEQVHLWQTSIGTPSRRGYHNREWSKMCEAIGLMPSNSGRPGGAKVGEQMDHYIIEGGLFDKAATELIDIGFRLSWVDRFAAEVPRSIHLDADYQPPDLDDLVTQGDDNGDEALSASTQVSGIESLAAALTAHPVIFKPAGNPAQLPEPSMALAASAIAWPSDARPPVTRTKYRCPGCGAQVWGKASLDIQCNRCDRLFAEITDGGHPRRRVSDG